MLPEYDFRGGERGKYAERFKDGASRSNGMIMSATPPVPASLRSLLRGVIDYAGIYPPARLPIEKAWANYLAYRGSPYAWMLSHFVLGIGDVDKLTALAASLSGSTDPVPLALVARPAETETELFNQGLSDFQSANQTIQSANGRILLTALECKLPDDLSGRDGTHLRYVEKQRDLGFAPTGSTAEAVPAPDRITTREEFLTEIVRQDRSNASTRAFGATVSARKSAEFSSLEQSALFMEVPLGPAWESLLVPRVDGIVKLAKTRSAALIGLKLRTGGLDAAAFPSVEQVAVVIDACRRKNLPWKATAGLHHPIRQHRPEVNCPMHGFINVLVATVLAAAHELPAARLVPILADESPEHFHFDDTGLSWNGLAATIEQIEAARRDGMISFGSCSFDEPREDLRALGWL